MPVAETVKRIDPDFWRNLLRRYRFTNNIKQAALAHDLGVTQAMVSRWESGAVWPAAEMRDRILRLAGMPEEMSSPLVGWRQHVASQPGIAAVIARDGTIETVSIGLAREVGLERSQIAGNRIDSVFSGDLVTLHNILIEKGFFDGALESVESADWYCFANSYGKRDIGLVHGLHWPHATDGEAVRWMLTGARISPDAFDSLRKELGGQVGPTTRD